MYQDPESQAPGVVVGAQADLLMQRLQELERALAVHEWWLLGRALPEARALAEVTSLLSVARAELDGFLVQHCGRAPADAPPASDNGSEMPDTDDPAQLGREREEARQILGMLAAALPPTSTFARQLRPFAERNGMPVMATDTLGIVADRIAEAQELLQNLQP